MKFLFLNLLFFSGSALAAPASFNYQGHYFNVVKSGRSVKVAPAAATARLSPDAGGPDCEQIYTEIHRREYLFEACNTQPDMAACRALKKSLRLLAEGRPDTDTPVDSSAGRSYSLSAPNLSGVDIAGLRAAASAEYHVKPDNVEVLATGTKVHFASPVNVLFERDSAFAKVSKLVDFRLDDLAQFPSSALMVSRNSVLACDVAGGHASVVASAVSTLAGVDHVPAEAVDAAWLVYRGLSKASNEIDAETQPLVKAAVIGFYIAQAVPAQLPDDPAVTVNALFQRLFNLSLGSPVLRPFGDREAMRAAAFPDVTFEDQIGQSWSVQ